MGFMGKFSSGVKAGYTAAGKSAAHSGMVKKAVTMVGNPTIRGLRKGATVNPAQAFKRGRRRLIMGGGLLAGNAVINKRPPSSGSQGYTTPRSSGGYA